MMSNPMLDNEETSSISAFAKFVYLSHPIPVVPPQPQAPPPGTSHQAVHTCFLLARENRLVRLTTLHGLYSLVPIPKVSLARQRPGF
jgi:hypothetical protein